MKIHTDPPKGQHTVSGHPTRLELVKQGAANPHFSVPETGQHYVDVDRILPDPRNERKNLRDMDELAASIQAVGLIEPPTVTPLGNGQYKLLTGERRWRAAKAAGLKRIHVIVDPPEAENRRRLKSLISNIQRADLGPIELAQALRALKEEQPEIQTNHDLARLIGRSEIWTSHMLNILKIPEHLQQELAKAKGISSEAAQQIARLQDPEAQSQLVQEALAGAAPGSSAASPADRTCCVFKPLKPSLRFVTANSVPAGKNIRRPCAKPSPCCKARPVAMMKAKKVDVNGAKKDAPKPGLNGKVYI